MAIIYSYPTGTVKATDMLIGSDPTVVGNPTKNFRVGDVSTFVKNDILGYTQYTCLVSQNGLLDPTSIDLKNDTGVTLTWSRVSPGIYRCNASSPIFTLNKTFVLVNAGTSPNGPGAFIEWNHSTSFVEINFFDIAGVQSDDLLDQGAFEIRIYS